LIRVHRAVIGTQKADQNRLKKKRATTTTHHAVGSRHCDFLFFSLLFSVFFKVQQTVHKATFYSGPPSVLNSPGRPVRQQSVSTALARGFGYELGVGNIPDL
jgi:hypothetical protein